MSTIAYSKSLHSKTIMRKLPGYYLQTM